jgi:hypothetical protein
MKSVSKLSVLGILLSVVATGLFMISPVLAQDDATYADLLATYGGWTREDVEAAGYEVEPICVDAASAGAPAELGGMGFHAVNVENLMDNVAQASKPDIILLDGEGNVIGVEYEIDSVVENPPTIDGNPLVFTPPHPGVEHEHMSLHVFFVGDEAYRFGTWNPAVTCPPGSTAPMDLPETGGAQPGIGQMSLLLLGLGVGLMAAGLLFYRAKVKRLA